MIISAIWRSSEEMPRIDGSSRFSTYGPSTMPVKSIPIILGSPIRSQTAAMARPARKINASEVNMFSSHFCARFLHIPSLCQVCADTNLAIEKFYFSIFPTPAHDPGRVLCSLQSHEHLSRCTAMRSDPPDEPPSGTALLKTTIPVAS